MIRRNKILGLALLLVAVTSLSLGLLLSHDSPCGVAPAVPANTQSMQAAVYRCYGSPDVVKLEDVAKPALADDRVLVKVHAASVNPLDWHYVRGQPYLMRALGVGLGTPDDIRLGVDFAGTVEAVGKDARRFKPGDEVFGGAGGAFAQYVRPRDNGSLALKPPNVTFEQAAAVPVAAVTALQALRDKGKIKPGQKVLINGASGGVGTFAVQIAKSFGTDVTGVTSTRNVDMVRSIGADHVIDYTREDFVKAGQLYDLILDCVGNRPLLDFKRILKANGIYVGIGGGGPDEQGFIGPLTGPVKQLMLSQFVSQKFVPFVAELNKEDLSVLGDLMQAGKLTPVIDRRYKLSETAQALRYVELGHARGKVVITVD
jgi:NADPH:quinone reductase-like Zn-dependent oxidoreductase